MPQPPRSNWPLLWIGALILSILAFAFFRLQRPTAPVAVTLPISDATANAGASGSASSTPVAEPPPAPFAERILADYANPARPPEDDLRDIARTLENFALLVKGDNPLPLGANEEVAAALRGKNRVRLRALPDDSRAFNAQSQIVDRWASPLYFHAESRDRIDIRSAGPDRVMWTADDLHRKHDGRFLHGEALLAPSLAERATDRR